MATGIIHLSDMHIREKDNDISAKATKVVRAIWGVNQTVNNLIVAITGDIAFSGKNEEYNIAREFIKNIESEIAKISSIQKYAIFIVPGNHDCNFDNVGGIRSAALGALKSGEGIDKTITDAITQVQANFKDLETEIHKTEHLVDTSAMSKSYTIDFKNKIRLNLINTAFASEKKETKGALVLPIDKTLKLHSGEDIIITCFHHPYGWFTEDSSKEFKKAVEMNSDIILTGHEHDFDAYAVYNFTGYNAEYIEGHIFSENKDKETCGFNYIIVDKASSEFSIYRFLQDGDSYKNMGSAPKRFVRNKAIKRSIFEYNTPFEQFLADPGANFLHPAKRDGLKLDDIFVFPELIVNSFDSSSIDKAKTIPSRQTESFITEQNKIILSGPEKCGKTTLLKKIVSALHAAGYAPTYVNCCSISHTKATNCVTRFQETFTANYMATLEDLAQLEQERRVIILDNFHRLACSARERCILLHLVESYYGKIIITSDEIFDISELSYEEGASNPLLSYVRSSVRPFGKHLKEQLIEKWLILDREMFRTNEQLNSALYNISNVVDTFFGTKLIPYYPLFILIITQQIHSSRNIDNANGSQGEMYEMLIKQTINEHHNKIDSISQINYLSHFAYTLFIHKNRALTETEFKSFHVDYCAQYKETFGFETITSELMDSSILVRYNGMFGFRYNYFYYYFAAKYISTNFSQSTSIQALVKSMTKHVYIDEYAQLLIFLSYLSDHKSVIIEDIMLTANDVYADLKPCDFDEDVSFLNKLGQMKPEIECAEYDGRESRQLALQAMDTIEANSDGLAAENAFCGIQERKEVEFIDDVLKMTVSLRCIDILGQILKNFSGTLPGELRLAITGCCYKLGLRTISFYMNIFSENVQAMWSDLSVVCLELDPALTPEQIYSKVHKFVFFANLYTSADIVQKVASSIGLQRLELTYKELLDDKSPISMLVLDTAVKLESFADFPEKDVFKVYDKLDRNFFTQILVKLLVIKRFEMRQHYRKVFRSVCERLGIKFNNATAVSMIKQKKAIQ